MKCLLDTHALLWWLTDDRKLGPHAREIIDNTDNDILVSMVSFWEIAVKIRAGKMRGDLNVVTLAAEAEGFGFLGITPAHLRTLMILPLHHRDPFDHLLIAQAIAEGATLMSEDQHTPQYTSDFVRCSG